MIKTEKLTKIFRTEEVETFALNHVSVEVKKGEFVAIMGPSGDFATKRAIKIGLKNPKYYEVLEGLEKGEKVITSGYDMFGDNDKLILK